MSIKDTYHTIFAEQQGRIQFQRYVQRVAFNLTLSAPMIACLEWIRDDPGVGMEERDSQPFAPNVVSISGKAHIYVTEVRALERRGLVWYDEPKGKNKWPRGHKYQRLTRVGELTCDLLVEAGMMQSRKVVKKIRKPKAA